MQFKKKGGITLVALVITIIVLLILAGVSISLVVGDDGVLSNATDAVDATNISEIKDAVNQSLSGITMDYYTESYGLSSSSDSAEETEDEEESQATTTTTKPTSVASMITVSNIEKYIDGNTFTNLSLSSTFTADDVAIAETEGEESPTTVLTLTYSGNIYDCTISLINSSSAVCYTVEKVED